MMNYLKRTIDDQLSRWMTDPGRKPLLLRGARGVGKTTTVRRLAENFSRCIKVDFSTAADDRALFASGISTPRLWENLAAIHGVTVRPGRTLLFLDNIEACPEAVNRLRYFYEKLPDLHVIAAGTRIDEVLSEVPSFGVGRVRSVFLQPLSFEEFLRAQGKAGLADLVREATAENPLLPAVHAVLTDYLRTFFVTGGMPEVVSTYLETHDLMQCREVLDAIIALFREDFSQTDNRIPAERLFTVLKSAARQTRGKFVFSKVGEGLTNPQVKKALARLMSAGLLYPVTHSSAVGLPLAGAVNEKYRRMLPLDTGIMLRLLETDLRAILQSQDFNEVNSRGLVTVFAGTELMKAQSPYRRPELFCWHREDPRSRAAVDYVVQVGADIVPVEVKAMGSGAMQSMKAFLTGRKNSYGVRASFENFGPRGNIRTCPVYAVGNLVCPPSGTYPTLTPQH